MSNQCRDECRKESYISIAKKAWENLEMSIGAMALVLTVVFTFSNVIARFIIGNSIQWSEEVSKFLVVWMAFGGSAYAFRMGANIGVSFFVERLPKRLQVYIEIIINMIVVLFYSVLVYHGSLRVINLIQKGQVSTAARIPLWLPYSAIPIGSALVIIRIMQQIITGIKNKSIKDGEIA